MLSALVRIAQPQADKRIPPCCRFLKVLKPGGRLLISDYCKAPGQPSEDFAGYIKQRGYDLHSVEEYGRMLQGAGFAGVEAEDRTWQVQNCRCKHSNMSCTSVPHV